MFSDTSVNRNSGAMPKRQNNLIMDLSDLEDSL